MECLVRIVVVGIILAHAFPAFGVLPPEKEAERRAVHEAQMRGRREAADVVVVGLVAKSTIRDNRVSWRKHKDPKIQDVLKEDITLTVVVQQAVRSSSPIAEGSTIVVAYQRVIPRYPGPTPYVPSRLNVGDKRVMYLSRAGTGTFSLAADDMSFEVAR